MSIEKITNAEKRLYKTAKESNPGLYKVIKDIYRKEGIAYEIEEKEIRELRSLVSKDGELQRRLKAYQKLSPFLDSNQKKAAEEAIAKLIYARLGNKNVNYDMGEIIRVYIPKIGLGPLKMSPGSISQQADPESGIEQWLFLIENEDDAAKILSRAYEQDLLKKNPNPTPAQIKTFLDDKLKNGK